jgi:hypothetical protein
MRKDINYWSAIFIVLVFVPIGLGNPGSDIGGINCIKNSSFEEVNPAHPELPRYWDKWFSDSAKGDVRITSDQKTEGRRSLQMTYSQGWKADQWIKVIQRFSGLKPNVPYTLTAYAKQVKGEGAHRGLILFLGNRWTCYDLLRDEWEQEWKRVTVNFVLDPADIDSSGRTLIVLQLDVPGVYCIDDIQIRPYNPIEILSAKDLEKKKIYLVKKEAEVKSGLTAIPPGLPVYSVSAGSEHRSTSDLPDTYTRLPDIKDKRDLSATYALAYSDQGLHLYVDVIDDVVYIEKNYLSLTPEKNEGLYNVDSIQVSIDQGLERTSRWDENDLEFGFALGQRPEKPQTWCWTLGRGLDRDDGRWSVTRTPRGYFVDALLTWKFLDKIDRRGKKAFGFNLLVNDNDGKGRKGFICVSRGIGEVKYTQDNAVAILDEGNTNIIGLFKADYTGNVSAPLLLFSLDKLNGRIFNLLARDEQGKTQNLLFKPYKLDIPPNTLGLLDANFRLDAFKSGTITVQVLADEKPIKEFSFKKIGLQESLDAMEKEVADLAGKVEELKKENKPTGYLSSKLAVLSSQTLFAKDNLADYTANHSAYYLGKAMRRISENEALLKMAKQELADLVKGDKIERYKTYRYVTSPITLQDGYPGAKTVDDFGQTATRPVIFNGYCMGIDWNIDTQPATGKATVIKETGEKIEVTGNVGKIIDSPSLANSSMSFFKNLPLLKEMGGNAMIEMCKPTWAWQVYNLDYPPNFAQGPGLYQLAKGIKGPFYYNSFHDRFSQFYESAYKNDFIITFNLWSISLLPWVYEKYPEMQIPGGFGGGFAWFNYQINTPGAKKVLSFLVKNLVKEIKEDKYAGAVHSFDIANETAFGDTLYDIPIQKSFFLTHLKAKYSNDIQRLNKVWNTPYKTFEEVLPANAKGINPANRVVWWEWHVYAQESFNAWHKWLADVVHEAWPAAVVYAKPMASGFARSHGANVDYELFSEWIDINSCDTFLYYKEGDYISTWLDAALNYDLLSSLKRTTILNAENHIIRDAEGRDIPYEYVYTTLFQQYMHGLSLSSTWSWMEQRENSGYNHVKGLFAERPMCIAALNQATLDANRLVFEVKAFFDEKPKVAILYSPTAMIKDTQQTNPEDNYDTSGIEVYKHLSFMGYKVGFISEKQIAGKEFGNLEIIIAPKAEHVLKSTVESLKSFTDQGKTILSIGPSFSKDQYDNPLGLKLPMIQIGKDIKQKALAKALKIELEKKLGVPPIEVTVNNDIPDGIEWKIIKYKNGYLLNMVNYNKEAKVVVLNKTIEPKVEFQDLITCDPVKPGFSLDPLKPVLIKINLPNEPGPKPVN